MTDHLRNRFANVAERLTHSFTELTAENHVYANGEIGLALQKSTSYSAFDSSVSEDPENIDTKPVMTFRDRTTEFGSTVKSLQSRQMLNGAVKPTNVNRTIQERTEFAKLAKKVGRDLASTCVKLEKLSMLAKKKTLFDDKPLEIQELTYIIKQDLNSLNEQIGNLSEWNRSRSGSSTSNKHVQTHSSTVVVALQSRLANLSTDFKSALDIRSENLKASKWRRDQYSTQQASNSTGANVSGVGDRVREPNGHLPDRSVLFRDEQMAVAAANEQRSAKGANSSAINMSDYEYQSSSGQIDSSGAGGMVRNRHVQQMALLEETDSYVTERAAAMENIESTVVELGHIFSQLATMVKEQDEMIGRMDHNVEDSLMNVHAAHGEILKYFQSVSSNRWLMFKVFGVLIVFFIMFVLFFA